MTKVICEENCGNAPRKEILRDLNAAFARGEVEDLVAYAADDIVWDLVGERRVEGLAAFRRALESAVSEPAALLHIHNIITHGNTAAVHAQTTMADGRRFSFCDVYTFKGFVKTAKIKQITSYCIEVSGSLGHGAGD